MREFSATDLDAYAYLVGDTPGGAAFLVFTDVNATATLDTATLGAFGYLRDVAAAATPVSAKAVFDETTRAAGGALGGARAQAAFRELIADRDRFLKNF